MTEDEIGAACALVATFGLAIEGVPFPPRFRSAACECLYRIGEVCLRRVHRHGVTPLYIDCGGGLEPGDDLALADFQRAVRYARTIFPVAATWAEHGRYVTHSSTALVCGVVDVKNRTD